MRIFCQGIAMVAMPTGPQHLAVGSCLYQGLGKVVVPAGLLSLALAVALLDARGFGPEDFARSHPGGKLGLRLLTHVADVMRTGDALPLVAPTATLSAVIVEISRKGMGLALVVDDGRNLLGVFTDGDLRRLIDRVSDLRSITVDSVMSRTPRSIGAQALAVEGVALMEKHRINQLPVVDADNRVVGALNMHDLFAAGVV